MYIIFYEKFDNNNYKSIDKKKIIALIDKNEINIIMTTLIKKIKKKLKTKCRFNLKTEKITKIFMKIKKEFLKESIFKIINNM